MLPSQIDTVAMVHTFDSARFGELAGNAEQLASGTADHEPPLVLIVDDSADNREIAAMLLEMSGFDTITAGNGLESSEPEAA